jgi:hypothetical protein
MEVTLETPRLLLRRFRGSDPDAYAEMSADPEVMKFIGTGVTLNRNEAWRSIASIRVAEKLGERFAGETDLLGGKVLIYEARRIPP